MSQTKRKAASETALQSPKKRKHISEDQIVYYYVLVTEIGHLHLGKSIQDVRFGSNERPNINSFCERIFPTIKHHFPEILRSTDILVYKTAELNALGYKYLLTSENILDGEHLLCDNDPTLRLGSMVMPLIVVVKRTIGFDSDEHFNMCAGYVFCEIVDGQRTQRCFTAFDYTRLVTYKHGSHQDHRVGTKLKIQSAIDGNANPYTVSVVHVDQMRDFLICESDKDICAFPPYMEIPTAGRRYHLFGLGATGGRSCKIGLSIGIVVNSGSDRDGYSLGSSGSFQGDSGGGLFSKNRGLLGINIGDQNRLLNIKGDPSAVNLPVVNLNVNISPARCRFIPSYVIYDHKVFPPSPLIPLGD